MNIGPIQIEAGGIRHGVGRFWVPDGLHIWVGLRGVHIYWSKSKWTRRVSFDRADER